MFPRAAEAFADAGFVTIDTLALLELDLRTTRRPTIRLETKRLTRRQTRDAVAIDRRAFGARWANDSASLTAIRRATPTYRARQLSVDGELVAFAISGTAGSTGYLQRLGNRSPLPARGSGQVARCRRAVLDARSSPRQRARQHGDRQRGSARAVRPVRVPSTSRPAHDRGARPHEARLMRRTMGAFTVAIVIAGLAAATPPRAIAQDVAHARPRGPDLRDRAERRGTPRVRAHRHDSRRDHRRSATINHSGFESRTGPGHAWRPHGTEHVGRNGHHDDDISNGRQPRSRIPS